MNCKQISWDREHMNAKVNLKSRDIDDRYTYLTARVGGGIERDHTYICHHYGAKSSIQNT